MTKQFTMPARQPFHTFIFGIADEAGMSGLIASAESHGCEFIQAIACQVPDPRPVNLLVPGVPQRPQTIRAFQILVRILASEFPALVAKLQAANAEVKS